MQAADSENMSSIDLAVPSVTATDTRGKYRILAELKLLEQETRFLEEELEAQEETKKVSNGYNYKELVLCIESRSDPLLPLNNGPENPLWDRWFEGPQDSQSCRCWVL